MQFGKSSASSGNLRMAFLLLVLTALVAMVAPGCGNGSNAAATAAAGEMCHQNSDCASGLICALGACRAMCSTAKDCPDLPTSGECVEVNGAAVCEYPGVAPSSCNTQADCLAPLACASDYHCRNLCKKAADCNVLGIMGEVCATDKAGVHFCAPPADVSSTGMLDDPPPTGVDASAPVMEYDGGESDAASSNDASTTTHDSGGKDATMTSDGATSNDATVDDGASPADVATSTDATMHDGASSTDGGTTADASGDAATTDGGSAADASGDAGSDAPVTCASPCGPGYECLDASCVTCGKEYGQPCCGGIGGSCTTNLNCSSSGTCVCGAPGEFCCAGTQCPYGGACLDGGTCQCGASGQVCCPADSGASSACNAELQCAGSNCTCIVAAHQDIVQLTDGSLWMYSSSGTPTQVTVLAGTPFYAGASFATLDNSAAFCALEKGDTTGGVYCWDATGTANNDGELGNGKTGSTSGSIYPTAVATNASGSDPLTGITHVFAAADGNTACAINASGALWCWGSGANYVFGTGTTANYAYAVPIPGPGGGAQFTGVTSVSIAADHVCALAAADGGQTLWCWGSNGYGQIGQGNTSTFYQYPTQVAALFNDVVNVTVDSDGTSYGDTCATTSDGSVWCWGMNSYGQIGNGTTSSTGVSTPSQVLSAPDGGAPFSGAASVDLAYYGFVVVAEKAADGSLWRWSTAVGAGTTPAPYTEGGYVISGVFLLTESRAGTNPQFIDAQGLFHRAGAVATSPPCP